MHSKRGLKKGFVLLLVISVLLASGCNDQLTGRGVDDEEIIFEPQTWLLDPFYKIEDPYTKIVTGEGYITSDLMDVMGEIEDAKIPFYEYLEKVAKSDVETNIKKGETFSLTSANFPVLKGLGDPSLDIKLIDDPAEFRLTYTGLKLDDEEFDLEEDTYHTINLELFFSPKKSTEEIEVSVTRSVFGIEAIKDAKVSTTIELVNISTKIGSEASVDLTVDGDLVLLNGTAIAERHGDFIGLNFPVTEGVGGVGSTAGEKSQYSTHGAAIQKGGIWYYVDEVEGPEAGEEKGTLILKEVSTGDTTTLEWNVASQSSFVTYGAVIGTDMYAYDYVSEDYTDGISYNPLSTAVITYDTDVESFTGDTDWSTYTTLVFETGEIDLGYEDGEIVLTPTGFDEDVEADVNYDGSITLSEAGDVEDVVKIRVYADTNMSLPPDPVISDDDLVMEAVQNQEYLVVLGDHKIKRRVTSACGELKFPDGEKIAMSWYDKEKMEYLLDFEEGQCPLEKIKTPYGNYIFFDNTSIAELAKEIADTAYAPVDEELLAPTDECDDPGCVIACRGRTCKKVKDYLVTEEEEAMCSNVGDSCCSPARYGECERVPHKNHPKGVEVETDRRFWDWECDFKVYEWIYCRPYNEETCMYEYENEQEKRILLGEGTYSGFDFVNCGSKAYEEYTRPWGVIGVKG